MNQGKFSLSLWTGLRWLTFLILTPTTFPSRIGKTKPEEMIGVNCPPALCLVRSQDNDFTGQIGSVSLLCDWYMFNESEFGFQNKTQMFIKSSWMLPWKPLVGIVFTEGLLKQSKQPASFIKTNNGPLEKAIDIYCHGQVGHLITRLQITHQYSISIKYEIRHSTSNLA